MQFCTEKIQDKPPTLTPQLKLPIINTVLYMSNIHIMGYFSFLYVKQSALLSSGHETTLDNPQQQQCGEEAYILNRVARTACAEGST